MLKPFFVAIAVCSFVIVSHAEAQRHPVADFVRDYFKLVPRAYSPDDPWTMGHVLRKEVGFGGFFFNCDGEQNKRYSPYIRWNCQIVDCPKRLIHDPLIQQLHEIRQRVRWGGCIDCQANYQDAASYHGGGVQCNCAGVSPVVPQTETAVAGVQLPQIRSPQEAIMPPQNLQHNDRKVVHNLLQQSRQTKKLPFGNHNVVQPPTEPTAIAAQNTVARLLQQARGRRPVGSTELASEPTNTPTPMTESGKKDGFLSQLLSPVRPQRVRGMGVAPRQQPGTTARTASLEQGPSNGQIQASSPQQQQPTNPVRRPERQANSQSATTSPDAEFSMIRR